MVLNRRRPDTKDDITMMTSRVLPMLMVPLACGPVSLEAGWKLERDRAGRVMGDDIATNITKGPR